MNTATATGMYGTETVSDTDDELVNSTPAPAISIEKVVDLTEIGAPGSLTYTITITNTGNVVLTGITVTDAFAGGATYVTGDTNGDNRLDLTETWTYTATYTVSQTDIDSGQDLVNLAVVDTDETGPAEDEATTEISQAASVSIEKNVDIDEIAAPGTLTYTITVENTGTLSLTNVVLTDDFASNGPTLTGGDINNDGILQIDETWTYTATYNVTQADINQGDDLVNIRNCRYRSDRTGGG